MSKRELDFLEEARKYAKKARVLPKVDIFRVCELIQFDIELMTPEILDIFIRSLPQAFGRPTAFNSVGTKTLSWDEKWLLSLVLAVSRADYDSVRFLIQSTVKPRHQQECQYIAAHLGKIKATG